jgi:hypothetical protein
LTSTTIPKTQAMRAALGHLSQAGRLLAASDVAVTAAALNSESTASTNTTLALTDADLDDLRALSQTNTSAR